ncbi:MAG: RNA-binding transcriptional accessory protein [Deltaproteobacteria bacterium]|jgi:uncharacterized protein|nr:RNA-binding transcriptional accessory protein [Deltaproteobacteria bacterium]
MSVNHFLKVAEELGISVKQVEATVNLLNDGGTVPFIARYRKEMTGALDEVQVLAVRDRLKALEELNERLEAILKSLTEREILTPELEEKLRGAETMAKLEDIYLPYRPKKRTKAMIAKENGLEPLALTIFKQDPTDDPLSLAAQAIADGAKADSEQSALAGARDIIAEMISENERAREKLRDLFMVKSAVKAVVKAGKEEQAQKYADYFDFSEKISAIPSHRYLAIRRAEAEGLLSLSVRPETDEAMDILRKIFLKNDSPAGQEVEKAVQDAYKRLLSLSLETEARLMAKKRADLEAIGVFAKNLKELLMAPPLGGQAILAVDPGFRTGCKLAALSNDGTLLEYATVQPHASAGEKALAQKKIAELVKKHDLKAAAVGNGTAGRETHAFIRKIPELPEKMPVVLINESGASIYSASELAREEFPDLDLTIRGAVSIGRRLMDPLAELVKIDPKSIGVGQYQHDVDQNLLKNSLDDVVESCVNSVGVEANTASEKLLSYVSGLGPSLAKNIVKFRREKGPFKNRQEFMLVPRLGPKAFEQCAGFLRLAAGDNPLDRSAVHPESYHVVERMAQNIDVPVDALIGRADLRSKINPHDYVTENIGLPTINDILGELEKPGRDPRADFKPPSFVEGLDSLADATVGMQLPGIVTNVTAFGAFVDVGLHTDGLVHLSEMSATRFVKNALDVTAVGQAVTVWVKSVDIPRNRLSLTMKGPVTKEEKEALKAESVAGAPSGAQGRKKTPEDRAAGSRRKQEENRYNPFAKLKDLY